MRIRVEQDGNVACMDCESRVTTFKPRRFCRATERAAKRYSSDLSDRDWEVVQPLLQRGDRHRQR